MTTAIQPGAETAPPLSTALLDAWIGALARVCRDYGLEPSLQRARLEARWHGAAGEDEAIAGLARGMGLRLKVLPDHARAIDSHRLPLIIELVDGRVGVVGSLGADGVAEVTFAGEDTLPVLAPVADLTPLIGRAVVARPARRVRDARVDDYIRPYEAHWLRRLVIRDWRPYGYVLIASLVANTLGLTGIVFSGQVYDRVIPAESMSTLFVLFSGVVLALLFDFIMRRVRHEILDLLGKDADRRLSDVVFGHALHVRNQARPRSTGSFIAQLRDLEHVRELMTSTTVSAIADLPFFFMFLGVMCFIGGKLALVPLIGLVLMLTPGLLLQGRLRKLAQTSMREASLRNAMLVEAVQGIEDIKSLQAEARFSRLWNHYNAVTAEAQLKLRALTNGMSSWVHTVQMLVYAGVVVVGAPMVIAGDITTGGLVAASLLGSRMISPMAHLSQVLARLQQARVAAGSLESIMRLPVDHAPEEARVHLPAIAGAYEMREAAFRHGDGTTPIALAVSKLSIAAGDRIAVLGRNGAGKSTLLKALAGQLDASAGEVTLDGVALAHIDPADVRRDVTYVGQDARLFHGSLRENLMMGAPDASDADLVRVLELTGALEFVRRLPKGLDHPVGEGGAGFSQGQRQLLLLSRNLLRNPQVVILDEPTASLDETTERAFIARFGAWSEGRTVVVATHRMRALDLVNRIIVIDNGRVVLDDGKDAALRRLTGVKPVTPKSPAAARQPPIAEAGAEA